MTLDVCKFTVDSTRRFDVSGVGLGFSAKSAEVNPSTVFVNSRAPAVSAVSAGSVGYSTEFGRMPLPATSGPILASSGRAKVTPAVIELISVDMIDFMIRPRSRHVQKRKSMFVVSNTVDTNLPVAVGVKTAGPFAYRNVITKTSDPGKNASTRIVVENFAKALSGQHPRIISGFTTARSPNEAN